MAVPATELEVIRDADRAAAVLNPLRLRLLEHLDEPDSATGLARRLGLPRQNVNYHIRELEESGFVRLVEERRKGNCTERIVAATSRHYLISPEILGSLGTTGPQARDRFSSTYLVAAAARTIRDVAVLRHRAKRAGKRLATLTLETEVRFRSPAAQSAFAEDLARAVAEVAARHHDECAPGGRLYRFVVGGHPVITKTSPPEGADQ